MRRDGRSGQALIEAALALPVLLLLVWVLLAGSQLAQAKLAVLGVAREAARVAVQGEDAQARAAALAQGMGLTNGSFALAVVTPQDAAARAAGGYATAEARYTVRVVGLPGWGRVTVSGRAVERFDRWRGDRP